MHFPFPIGLLLFNSPEYSKQVLDSLKSQSLKIDESRLVIRIDGFFDSKPKSLGEKDFTTEVFKLASSYFGKAKIIRNVKNNGIAKQYWLLAEELYQMQNSDWALFLEHDFVLDSNYLESILKLIEKVENYSEVVQVDATGDTFLDLTRGLEHYYIPEHDWAFALKKEHHLLRNLILREYVSLISKSPYFLRDPNEIYSLLSKYDVYPIGSSIDYVAQAIRRKFGKISVTTGAHFGRYIGENGEDYTPEIFEKQGYGDWKQNDTTIDHYPEVDQSIIEKLKIEDCLALNRSSHEVIKFFETEYTRIVHQYQVQSEEFDKEILFLHKELSISHKENLRIKKSLTYKILRKIFKL